MEPLAEDRLFGQWIWLSRWMAACVGCGLCGSACRAALPLTAVFSAFPEGVQDQLEYVPGRSLREPLPGAQIMMKVEQAR